jgi:hypothetical protein
VQCTKEQYRAATTQSSPVFSITAMDYQAAPASGTAAMGKRPFLAEGAHRSQERQPHIARRRSILCEDLFFPYIPNLLSPAPSPITCWRGTKRLLRGGFFASLAVPPYGIQQ